MGERSDDLRDQELRDRIIGLGESSIHRTYYPELQQRLADLSAEIAERKQAEERQRIVEGRLRQAEKHEALGNLAGGIAHDFNNILQIILANAELATLQARSGASPVSSLDAIIQTVERGQLLTRQILAFARKRDPQRESLRVHERVTDAVSMVRATTPSTVEIETSIREDCPTVTADPGELQQVVMNLCGNAAQAVDGNGRITVSLDPISGSGQPCADGQGACATHLRLRVSDTGPGIPPQIAERIFEPYFTTKEPGEGTGLGLSVAHGIVTEIGGTIEHRNTDGGGAEFEIFLPCDSSATQAVGPGAVITTQRSGYRLVVVDDEPMVVRSMRMLLEARGHVVRASTSPDEILGWIADEPDAVDLVITDQTMPGMTGLLLAERLHAIRPSLPVIVCSGFIDPRAPEEAAQPNVAFFLHKPVRPKDLDDAIAKALR